MNTTFTKTTSTLQATRRFGTGLRGTPSRFTASGNTTVANPIQVSGQQLPPQLSDIRKLCCISDDDSMTTALRKFDAIAAVAAKERKMREVRERRERLEREREEWEQEQERRRQAWIANAFDEVIEEAYERVRQQREQQASRARIDSWLENSVMAPPVSRPSSTEQQSTVSITDTFRSSRFSQRRAAKEDSVGPQKQPLSWPPRRRKIDDLMGLPHPPDRPTAFWKARCDYYGPDPAVLEEVSKACHERPTTAPSNGEVDNGAADIKSTARQVAHWNAVRARFGKRVFEPVEVLASPPLHRPSRFQSRPTSTTHSDAPALRCEPSAVPVPAEDNVDDADILDRSEWERRLAASRTESQDEKEELEPVVEQQESVLQRMARWASEGLRWLKRKVLG